MKCDFCNQFISEILEDVIMEEEMKKLAKHKGIGEATDIYSYCDDENKRDDKEESIERKEKCEEQSNEKSTPEGGDVCDYGNQAINGKDKEELVELQQQQQQEEKNSEGRNKDNSTGIICELHVLEDIRMEIHEDMEELVCNMTA